MSQSPDLSHSPASGALKHISVIELDFHHDVLDGFLKIFQNSAIRVDVFTTAKNIALLANNSYSNNISFYKYSGGSKYSFLKQHAARLNTTQIVFINTMANDLGAYMALDKRAITVLRVHNVNKQFSPLSHLVFPKSLFFAWKFSSYIARQIIGKGFLFFRPLINKRICYFTFPDTSMTAYVKQKKFIDDHKIIPPIPLKIFVAADTAFETYTDVLNITIIGATDPRRRQYEEVTDALTNLFKNQNAPAIRLTLLGSCHNAYGNSIVEKLKAIQHLNFSLKTYHAQVPEPEFIEVMRHTHLIISPITNQATADIFEEVYGKTKTTGSILDFLKFGKVTLVPQHYAPPAELEDYVMKYNSAAHLQQTILNLLQDKKINALNQRSLQYVKENYAQEPVLRKTISIFTSLLKHD